jgi:hypothetical protein
MVVYWSCLIAEFPALPYTDLTVEDPSTEMSDASLLVTRQNVIAAIAEARCEGVSDQAVLLERCLVRGKRANFS